MHTRHPMAGRVGPAAWRATCRLRNRPRSLLVDCAIGMLRQAPVAMSNRLKSRITVICEARRMLPRRQRQTSSSRQRAGVIPLLRLKRVTRALAGAVPRRSGHDLGNPGKGGQRQGPGAGGGHGPRGGAGSPPPGGGGAGGAAECDKTLRMNSAAYLFGRADSNLDPSAGGSDSLFASKRVDGSKFNGQTFEHCTFANVSLKTAKLKMSPSLTALSLTAIFAEPKSKIVRAFVHGAFVRPYVQTRGPVDADKLSTEVAESNCLVVSSHCLCVPLTCRRARG